MKNRLTLLRNWMQVANIDFTFLTSTENVFYFSGFLSDPNERLLSLIIFQDSEPILVCPAMEQQDARNTGWDEEIIGYSDIDE